MPLFVGACVASAAFPVWFLINADVGHMPLSVSFAAGFLGGMLASPPGPNARCDCLPHLLWVVTPAAGASAACHSSGSPVRAGLIGVLMWCRATLLNVNEPEVRGVALALQTVRDDLGKGLGPLLVSLMVSAWGQ